MYIHTRARARIYCTLHDTFYTFTLSNKKHRHYTHTNTYTLYTHRHTFKKKTRKVPTHACSYRLGHFLLWSRGRSRLRLRHSCVHLSLGCIIWLARFAWLLCSSTHACIRSSRAARRRCGVCSFLGGRLRRRRLRFRFWIWWRAVCYSGRCGFIACFCRWRFCVVFGRICEWEREWERV